MMTEVTGNALQHGIGLQPLGLIPDIPQNVGLEGLIKNPVMGKVSTQNSLSCELELSQ